MYNLLQTVYNKEKKEIVVYLGFDDIEGSGVMVKNKHGKIYETSIKNLRAIRDSNGNPLFGNQIEKFDVGGMYFGIVKKSFWKRVQPDLSLEKYITKEVKQCV